MKRLFATKYNLLLILLLLIGALFCGGCQLSPQERNGVSLLPHNRPTMNDMRSPALGGVGFTY